MSEPDRAFRSALLTRAAPALAAGALLGLAWQPYGFWPLLLVGVPVFTLITRGQRPRRAFGLGYLFGLTLLGVSVNWLSVLGVWVAALLVAFEALFFGLLGVSLVLVTRVRGWPVWAAACWVAIEFAYARVPFGGFGWTRLAYAAVDTPLSGFLPLIGVTGVSFLVALLGQLVAWLILRARVRHAGRPLIAVIAVAAALVAGGFGLQRFQIEPTTTATSLNVGVVQGNVPGLGIAALGRARSVTANHLSETVDLMTRARLGHLPTPDLILWPENSTDIDPRLDATTQALVQSAVDVSGRPILVGAVLSGPGEDERQTAGLWWDPVKGVTATYAKRNLVPFGEWIPFRKQLLPLVPILEETGAQSVPGTEPGVLNVDVAGRPVAVGDIICFELAYDQTVYDVIRGGAQLIMVQSNNATYGGTGQIDQQFAITRARAMEARREIAVATTNSVSGFIDRNGTVVQRSDEFTAAAMVAAMPLRTGITPAVRLAGWLDWLAVVGALLGCAAGVRARRTARVGRVGDDGQIQSAAEPPGPTSDEGVMAR